MQYAYELPAFCLPWRTQLPGLHISAAPPQYKIQSYLYQVLQKLKQTENEKNVKLLFLTYISSFAKTEKFSKRARSQSAINRQHYCSGQKN